MAFQRYRLKYIGKVQYADQIGTKYRYNNNSIIVSSDDKDNTHLVSIAAHGYGKELSYEDKCAIVAYLGFDLDREIEEYKINHPADPSFGDTHYFRQALDPSKPYKKHLNLSSDDVDEINKGNPPVVASYYPGEFTITTENPTDESGN